MYAGGRDHKLREPCQSVLIRIESGEVAAAISAEVVQEILHRFSALGQPVVGAEMARNALDLFAPVLPITHAVMQRMPELIVRYRALAARDLVHVATCLEEGIGTIVSPDSGFDTVRELTRVSPEESEQL